MDSLAWLPTSARSNWVRRRRITGRATDAPRREIAMRTYLPAAAAVFGAIALTVHAQAPVPATPDDLVKAAKRAAGLDYAGTFLRICVAPDNLQSAPARGAAPPAARTAPDRALWYAKPYKVFDNL